MVMESQAQFGRRNRGRRVYRPISQINVTPMIDVMLVLLIVFMVTAPLLTTGVKVDLPEARAPQLAEPDDKALTVSVMADGQVYLNTTRVALKGLPAQVRAIAGANPDVRIYIRADGRLHYAAVVDVLGVLHTAGFSQAALVTRQPSLGKEAL